MVYLEDRAVMTSRNTTTIPLGRLTAAEAGTGGRQGVQLRAPEAGRISGAGWAGRAVNGEATPGIWRRFRTSVVRRCRPTRCSPCARRASARTATANRSPASTDAARRAPRATSPAAIAACRASGGRRRRSSIAGRGGCRPTRSRWACSSSGWCIPSPPAWRSRSTRSPARPTSWSSTRRGDWAKRWSAARSIRTSS